jgi:hypothetical protein
MPLSSVVGASSILKPGVCTSSTRPAAPFEGQTIYETDTDLLKSYNGSSWVTIGPTMNVGAQSVIPTSVTVTGGSSSGSVGTNGKVTFASAENVSINGAFSAAFTNYAFVIDFDTSAATPSIYTRLRVGGSDNSSSNSYVAQRVTGNNTTVGGSRVTSTQFDFGSTGASVSTNGARGTFYRPFAADTTGLEIIWTDSESSAYFANGIGTHNQNTSYDGFTLIASTGNISGTVTIYGYFG